MASDQAVNPGERALQSLFLPAHEIPAELLRLMQWDLARCGSTRETPACVRSKLCSGEKKQPSSDAIISSIQDARVSRLELIFRSAPLCKSPLLATLFANRAVYKRPEPVSNPMSLEYMTLYDIHFLSLRRRIRVEFDIWMCPPMADGSRRQKLFIASVLFLQPLPVLLCFCEPTRAFYRIGVKLAWLIHCQPFTPFFHTLKR